MAVSWPGLGICLWQLIRGLSGRPRKGQSDISQSALACLSPPFLTDSGHKSFVRYRICRHIKRGGSPDGESGGIIRCERLLGDFGYQEVWR